MRFSMGLWDWLFGEKVRMELPDGQTRTVTRRWVDEMIRQRKIAPVTDQSVEDRDARVVTNTRMLLGNALNPAVTFYCTHCFIGMDAEDYLINTEISCPRCGTTFCVPTESQKPVARGILEVAKLLAGMSVKSFDDRLPELWDVCSSDDWVYFSTAAMFSSSIMLEEDGELRVWRLQAALAQLPEIDSDVFRAADDYIKAWLRATGKLTADQHASMWLLTSLLQRSPSVTEIQRFGHVLGPFVLRQSQQIRLSFPGKRST
jgi:hypothetical protein